MALSELPLGLPEQAALLPAVASASVWYWTLHRPAAMPPAAVFAIGLWLDLRGYLPLGVGVLTLLGIHGAALRWQRYLADRGLALPWIAFLPLAAGSSAAVWGLTSLLTFRWLSPAPALFQAALTAALYPLAAAALSALRRAVPDPDDS
jgi:rod shape-determining protein MreD